MVKVEHGINQGVGARGEGCVARVREAKGHPRLDGAAERRHEDYKCGELVRTEYALELAEVPEEYEAHDELTAGLEGKVACDETPELQLTQDFPYSQLESIEKRIDKQARADGYDEYCFGNGRIHEIVPDLID